VSIESLADGGRRFPVWGNIDNYRYAGAEDALHVYVPTILLDDIQYLGQPETVMRWEIGR